MSRPRPQWQLAALAAHRRDMELRKAEELKKVAQYYESHTNASKHHEQWTTSDYYEKAKKDAEKFSEDKLKAMRLEERRKKLEMMLFQEHMQYQSELKSLASQPKLFKNGSYINNVPTSTLQDINQGIKDKEEALRRHEAELRLHHAWRLNQPELRAASSYIANGKLKSAWMEQIVEKEMQKKRDEEENRKILEERDSALRRQIELEEARLKEKETRIRELRGSLEGQIAELADKEQAVKELRKQEERHNLILDELQFITKERERELHRIVSERDTMIVNMGLYKFKLKQRVVEVLKEIELDIAIMEKIRRSLLKDSENEREKSLSYKRVLDQAFIELEEHRERERQRQKNIEAMYDGEARQINDKQDKMWAKEREARALLMAEVLSALRRQVEEKIEMNRQQQKANVLEREKIVQEMEDFNQEVRAKEQESQLQKSQYSSITTLQSELNSLKVQRDQLEKAVSEEADIRAALQHEKEIRKEIANMQRKGSGLIEGRRNAWC